MAIFNDLDFGPNRGNRSQSRSSYSRNSQYRNQRSSRPTGSKGQPLLTEQEWLASHHVPHPGARGNRNAAGPHHLSPEGLRNIQEAGHRRAGKPHPMSDEGVQHIREAAQRRSQIYQKAKAQNNMSSRASGSGSSRRNRSSGQRQVQQQQYQSRGNMIDIRELRDMRDRLDEVLNEIAG
jgi:hypothetical protein